MRFPLLPRPTFGAWVWRSQSCCWNVFTRFWGKIIPRDGHDLGRNRYLIPKFHFHQPNRALHLYCEALIIRLACCCSVALEIQGYLTLRCSLKLTPRIHSIRASFCPLLSLEKGEYIGLYVKINVSYSPITIFTVHCLKGLFKIQNFSILPKNV